MTIYEQIKDLLKNEKNLIISSSEIKLRLNEKYGTKLKSIILSDFCYNRINKGIKFDKFLFQYINKSSYKFLGENYKYTGLIFHKPKGSKKEIIVGEWKNGIKELFKNSGNELEVNNRRDLSYLNNNQIMKLYEQYNEILRLELNILNCKPTEVRHLIGRIGEFYCVIKTNGKLASVTNQHGFDVISNNRKISVKTTAQTKGFISINMNTFEQFDDLFVTQYSNDDFKTIYYGAKEKILKIARVYNSKYEIDLSKLKKINEHTE